MTTPTPFNLGFQTTAQLLAVPEMAPTGYVNGAGIPDTAADCNTRANAVYAGFLRQCLAQLNEIMLGNVVPPGIGTLQGTTWRAGDDASNTVEPDDVTVYGITTPSSLWTLSGTAASEYAGPNMSGSLSTYYQLQNARGGVNGEEKFIYGGRTFAGNALYSDAAITIGQTVAWCGFVHIGQWNQANRGAIIATHRAYDRATETGASYRLGFELGIGDLAGLDDPGSLSLYYRHINASDVEVIRGVNISGSNRIALGAGREWFVGMLRTATTLDIFINGLLVFSSIFGVGDEPSPGAAAEMRLMHGGSWVGSELTPATSRYIDGAFRNVAMWNTSQPNAAQLLSFYRVGAGFLAKAP